MTENDVHSTIILIQIVVACCNKGTMPTILDVQRKPPHCNLRSSTLLAFGEVPLFVDAVNVVGVCFWCSCAPLVAVVLERIPKASSEYLNYCYMN